MAFPDKRSKVLLQSSTIHKVVSITAIFYRLGRSLFSCGFCACVKTTWTKATWEETVLFTSHLQSTRNGIRAGTYSSNLEAGFDVLTMEECYIVICFPWILQLLFYGIQDHWSEASAPTVSWTLLYRSLIKKMQHSLSHMWSDGGIFWIEISLHRYL